MKISKLFNKKTIKNRYSDREVSRLAFNSEEVGPGTLFFACKGERFNGENYIVKALEAGATGVVTESKPSVSCNYILVDDVRKSMAIAASNFYGNPEKKLKIITVVGTNGKTTTANIVRKILDSFTPTGIIGTLGASWKDKTVDTGLTTPDSFELFRLLAEMLADGITHVVMEASAHAIYYRKLCGTKAEAAIFTNISQDHLDFFGSMKKYSETKLSYFIPDNVKTAVVNVDDEYGVKLLSEIKVPYVTYGISAPADVFATDFSENKKQHFTLNACDEVYNVNTNLKGIFNRYNILAAIGCAKALQLNTRRAVSVVNNIAEIAGRYNTIEGHCKIVIDYAHTPDGLKNILLALKPKRGRLICVFGCGGNRDKTKRPLMGAISGRISDVTVITSDNPRFEAPGAIIRDIAYGCPGKCVCITDRVSAISYALGIAEADDTVLIAGKGCENYIDVNGRKIPYSDFDTVHNLLK